MPRGRPRKQDKPIYKTDVCFWCKKEFSYKVPSQLIQKMQRTNFQKMFCDRECERLYSNYVRDIERQAQALNEVRDKKVFQVCSECGLVPKHQSPQNHWCPKCHGRYILREVTNENDVRT